MDTPPSYDGDEYERDEFGTVVTEVTTVTTRTRYRAQDAQEVSVLHDLSVYNTCVVCDLL